MFDRNSLDIDFQIGYVRRNRGFFENLFEDTRGIGYDIESTTDSDVVSVFVENESAECVESVAFDLFVDAGHHTLCHLVCGVPSECQSEDVIGWILVAKSFDTFADNEGFASARTGSHPYWSNGGVDCVLLLLVETLFHDVRSRRSNKTFVSSKMLCKPCTSREVFRLLLS